MPERPQDANVPDDRARDRDLRPRGPAPAPAPDATRTARSTPSRLTGPTVDPEAPKGKEAPQGRTTSPSVPARGPGRTEVDDDASAPATRRSPPPAADVRPAWFRRPRLLATIVAGVVGLGLVWVVVTGLLARAQLEQARTELTDLRADLAAGRDAGDLDDRLDTLAGHARRAHTLTTGPAWWTAAAVPWVGSPARAIRAVTAAGDDLARDALPAVGSLASAVEAGDLRSGGSVDLDRLAALAPDVDRAAGGFDAARDRLADVPTDTWLGPLDSATSEVVSHVDDAAARLGAARTAVQVLPPMLGATTPQRWFVAFQNNAEARGTGGIPGAFAVVTASRGRVQFERFESDDALLYPNVDVDGDVDFGAEQADYLAQYGYDLPFGDYRQTNESPHFPYAARIWAAMWEKKTGERITGAVVVDPTALSYLLRATGPVRLTDGSQITPDNLVTVTQSEVYARFPGLDNASIARRKDYLLDVAATTEKALLASGTDTATLVAGAARAISERRLLVWSSDPAVEQALAGTAASGTLPETDQPFGLLTVLNVAGSKLDYYLDRRITWARSGCGDTRDVTVTLALTNRAPASGLPAYVTFRADDPPAGTPVGSNRLVLDWFGTDGGLLRGVTIDGRPGIARVYSQRGHPVFRTVLEIGPGASRTVVLTLREPAGDAPVTLLAQPLVRPLPQNVVDDSC